MGVPRTGTSERRPAAEDAVEPPACMCREKKEAHSPGIFFVTGKTKRIFVTDQSVTKIILVFCFMRGAIF